MGKCRVAPLLGMTIPQGELQSLVMLHRIILVVVEAFPTRFESISMFTDSMCSVGALAKSLTLLKSYFGNRVSEILQLRKQISEMTDDLALVHHIPGEMNHANMGTHGLAKAEDLGRHSVWQNGPIFLLDKYKTWPKTGKGDREHAEIPRQVAGGATSQGWGSRTSPQEWETWARLQP